MTQLRMLNMKLCPSAIEALIHIFGEDNCLYALSLANNAIPDESWPIMVTAIGTRSSLRLVNLEHTLPFDLPVEYLAERRHARTQAVLDAISRNACVRRVILTANEHDEILLEMIHQKLRSRPDSPVSFRD
jgi:hypothetical protein